jgi:hypothetical protein
MQKQQENRTVQLENLAGTTASAASAAAANLDEKTKTDAQNSFLSYLGIQESDMARMDASQRQNLALGFQTFLTQYATLGTIGRTQQTNSVGASEGTVQGGGGAGGGGGSQPPSGPSG